MRSLLILTIAFLSLVVARSQEWATQPSEMSEASAQASRSYRVKVTSLHPFARQIGPPMGAKRVITPVPKDLTFQCSRHPTSSCNYITASKTTCRIEKTKIAGDGAGERPSRHYCEQPGLEAATTVAQVLSTRYGLEQREVLS